MFILFKFMLNKLHMGSQLHNVQLHMGSQLQLASVDFVTVIDSFSIKKMSVKRKDIPKDD